MELSVKPSFLPRLREDIELFSGGNDKYNSPTWVLHDPVSEKFFRLGWTEYEILSRWDLQSPEKVIEEVNAKTSLTITEQNIMKIINFLYTNNLLDFNNPNAVEKFYKEHSNLKHSRFKKLLGEYLFFRIPLIKPDHFLERFLPYVNKLISIKTLYFFAFLGIIGLVFVSRQYDRFIGVYDYFFTLDSMILLFGVITITKVCHELGHAFLAKYYGCRVSTMGVAFLVLFPVLYTDTTDTWRLSSRRQRVNIASAGIFVEFCLSCLALFLWGFTTGGLLSSLLIYIPTVSLLTTLLVNANPLLRFDGYHILSDLLSTDNLQNRSFSLATWYLRRKIFGINEPQPVICSSSDRLLYLIFAYSTWVYRFFLYLSIAILVYFFFFKALGLFLMLVEIYYFLVKPVLNEFGVSYAKIKEIGYWPNRAKVTLLAVFASLVLFFIPWQSRIEIPAVITFKDEAKIFSQHSAMLSKINVKLGDNVKKSDLLATQFSPEISYRLNKLQHQIKSIEDKIRQETGHGMELGEKQASIQDLNNKQAEYNSLVAENKKLSIISPSQGEVINISRSFKINTWVKQDDYLLTVADTKNMEIVSYIMEYDLLRLPENVTDINGKFYYQNNEFPKFRVKIVKINTSSNQYLDNPYFASIYGGELLVFPNRDIKSKRSKKSEDLILNDAVYKLIAQPLDENIELPTYAVRGYLQINVEKTSYAYRVFRRVMAVILRESGV